MKRTVLIFVFGLATLWSKAQVAQYGTFGLSRIYNSTLINPALRPDSTAVGNSFAIAPLLNFDFGFGAHMPLYLGDLTSSIHSGTLNFNELMGNIGSKKSADLGAMANISLFHFYFKLSKRNARIEIAQRLRFEGSTNFNASLVNALVGTSDLGAKEIDWSYFRGKAMAWNELVFGYSQPINSKWIVAGRLKYLTGLAVGEFYANTASLKLGTANGNSFDVDATYRSAVLDIDKPAEVLSNWGLGVDLGASYKIDERLMSFFGVNDLGFINWKTNASTTRITGSMSNFEFLNIGAGFKQSSKLDSLKTTTQEYKQRFMTSLSSHWNAGAKWQPRSWFHTMAMLDFYVIQGTFAYPGVTVAGTLNAGKVAEVMMNAGYNYGRTMRVGAGVSTNWFLGIKPWRFYLYSSNILGLMDAQSLKSLDIQLGLAWTWRGKQYIPIDATPPPSFEVDNGLTPSSDTMSIPESKRSKSFFGKDEKVAPASNSPRK